MPTSASAHLLSPPSFAPRQSTEPCCQTTGLFHAYIFSYQGTELPWFVIIYPLLTHPCFSVFMAQDLRIPRHVMAEIVLDEVEMSAQTKFFLLTHYISW
jgi:hypothetical protein